MSSAVPLPPFGIFTIIVLGESFVKILDDAQGITIGIDQFVFSIFGILVVCSLWWLYFADTAEKRINFAQESRGISWVYSHLFLAASLVAFGVGAKKLFAATLDYPDEPVLAKYRLLYTAAIVMYLLALALIDFGLVENKKRQTTEAVVHLISAVLVAILGIAMINATAIDFVIVIAAIMLLQVGVSINIELAPVEEDEPETTHHE